MPFNSNGIGIQNVKRRLAFLYPGKHELKTSDEEGFFIVSLMVELNDKKVEENVALPLSSMAVENILS